MREILFRGKQVSDGEWIEGYVFPQVIDGGYAPLCITTEPICANDYSEILGDWAIVDSSTVGQYTGLTDKNGKKIFEGDICKFREWDNGEMCWIGYVHFEHCQFIISGGANKECPSNFYLVLSRFSSENIEVIGNIHDNPELLEVEE